MRAGRLWMVMGGCLAIGLACVAGCAEETTGEASPAIEGMFLEPAMTLVGKPAPQFSLELLDGANMSLEQHKGKQIVVLDFFATWCPPCRMVMPALVSIIDEYARKDKQEGREQQVVLYAVSLGDPPEAIRQFQKQLGVTFPVALDKRLVAAKLYKVNPIPHKVLIGKDGTVQAVHLGAGSPGARTLEELLAGYKKQLRQELDALIAGKSLVKPKRQ